MIGGKSAILLCILGLLGLIAGDVVTTSILPFHVCPAMLCYVCFLGCVVCNIGIRMGRDWHVGTALSWCDTGLVYALATIGTGAWWGHQAWGSAWVWEPRLTGMLLMTLIFASWRLACAILGPALVRSGRLTATLLVLGLPSMFFTHVAVRFFGGIHPASVSSSGGHATWYGFVIVGISAILLGAGVWLLDRRHQQKAGRMATP